MSHDENRKPLSRVYLDVKDPKPLLVATDGRRLVAIPVETSASDCAGPITAETFEIARRHLDQRPEFGKPLPMLELNCRKDAVTFPGFVISRPVENFPNYRAILEGGKPARVRIALNAELLVGIQRALGSKAVLIEISDPQEQMTVLPAEFTRGDVPVDGAKGVLMPVRDDRIGWVKDPPPVETDPTKLEHPL